MKPNAPRVLLVDDDPLLLKAFTRNLRHRFEVLCAETAREGLALARRARPDVAVVDLKLPDMDGRELISRIQELLPGLRCVLMTGYGSPDRAVDALSGGAYDYYDKGCYEPQELEQQLYQAAIANSRERSKGQQVQMPEEVMGSELLGKSRLMRQLRQRIATVAPTRAAVLIHGESGSGKQGVAELLHRLSGRKGRCVTVNVCAYPESLIDAEFFGHEEGSFTGGDRRYVGFFGQADGGTLFLDEIGDMPLALQPKLLHVLETGRYRMLHGKSELRADCRVISATHRDLEARCRSGEFRTDLYYRLNAVVLRVPPLRDHREDIPLLAWHFVNVMNTRHGREVRAIERPVLEMLMRRGWERNNVRELRKAIETAVIFCPGDTLRLAHFEAAEEIGACCEGSQLSSEEVRGARFPESLLGLPRTQAKREANRAFLEWYLSSQLARHGYNVAATARAIGVQRPNLRRELRELGIEIPEAIRQEMLIKVP